MSPAKDQPELRWIDTATDCLWCGAPISDDPKPLDLEIHATDCPIYVMREEERRKRLVHAD